MHWRECRKKQSRTFWKAPSGWKVSIRGAFHKKNGWKVRCREGSPQVVRKLAKKTETSRLAAARAAAVTFQSSKGGRRAAELKRRRVTMDGWEVRWCEGGAAQMRRFFPWNFEGKTPKGRVAAARAAAFAFYSSKAKA